MIAIYVRQSVDKKDSISIEGQIEKCKLECDGAFKVYKDKGFSGKNTNRPAFNELLNDIKNSDISKIVVYRLDRFSRSIADFGAVCRVLKEKNVDFVSVNEKFDTTTPMGRAMLHIIMVFAELERETIGERIRDNYYERAKLGSWVGGPAPYGFDIVKIAGSNGKKISVLTSNENIQTVKMIYHMYANEEYSLTKLAKELTAQGIKGINKIAWDSVSVARVLHNPVYVKCDIDIYTYYKNKGLKTANEIREFNGSYGGMVVGKRDRAVGKYTNLENHLFSLANHQGMIDSETWLRCQYKMESNKAINSVGKGKHTWLTGLLKCGNCGYGFSVVKAKENLYLSCSGRTNYAVCDGKATIKIKELEFEIAKAITAILGEATAPNLKYIDENNLELTAQIEKIDEKIGRLISAISDGTATTIKYINTEIENLEADKKRFNKKIETMKSHKKGVKLDGIIFDKLEFEEKRLWLKS